MSKRKKRVRTLTRAEVEALMRRGAIGAAELDQRLRRQFVSPVPAFRGERR